MKSCKKIIVRRIKMIDEFIRSLSDIDWFSECGKQNSDYRVIYSVFEAYDDWNDKYLRVWEPKISLLEKEAQQKLGDDAIDEIFEKITAALGDTLWDKWSGFIERQDLYEEAGLENEMLDMVIRDLSWAFIEQTLEKNDFFTYLLNIYREGYFPCAWDGGYPSGKPVVL